MRIVKKKKNNFRSHPIIDNHDMRVQNVSSVVRSEDRKMVETPKLLLHVEIDRKFVKHGASTRSR